VSYVQSALSWRCDAYRHRSEGVCELRLRTNANEGVRTRFDGSEWTNAM